MEGGLDFLDSGRGPGFFVASWMGGGFFRNVQTFGPQPVNSEPSPTIVGGVYIVKLIFYCMFCIYYNLIWINVIEMQCLCIYIYIYTPSSMWQTSCIKVAVRLHYFTRFLLLYKGSLINSGVGGGREITEIAITLANHLICAKYFLRVPLFSLRNPK